MALHSSTDICAAAFDLLGEAGDVVLQMSRNVKSIYGRLIIDACIEMGLHIRAANIANDKALHIDKLLERLEVVELLTRTCRDRRYMPPAHYARLVKLTQSLGRQANGWKKASLGGAMQPQLTGLPA